MNTPLRSVVLCAVLLVVGACSMPATRIYSLYIPAVDGRNPSSLRSPLTIRIDAPDYLGQPYIADRTSPYQLRIAKYARWEAPPLKMVLNEFRRAVAASGAFSDLTEAGALPKGAYILTVHLTRFERVFNSGGRIARLELRVDLESPDRQPLHQTALSKQKALQGEDFEELARALSELLEETIRQSLDEMDNAING